MSQLICITGPDGSGKSTLCDLVAKQLMAQGKTVVLASIWDLLTDPDWSKNLAFKHPRDVGTYLQRLNSSARSLFLMHCLSQALSNAQKKSVDYIVMNAYWHKYAISEILYGSDAHWLKQVCKIFPDAEKTFYLDVSPETSLKRKTEFSAYEAGGQTDQAQGFLKLQLKAASMWQEYCRQEKWIVLDGTQTPEILTQLVVNGILK